MIPLHQANGRIEVTREEDDSYSFQWRGGDVVGISRKLLNSADAALLSVDADVVTIGPYRVRIVERLNDMVIARRIEDA